MTFPKKIFYEAIFTTPPKKKILTVNQELTGKT